MCCTPHSDAMVAVCLGIAYNNGSDAIVGDTTLVESLARKPCRGSEEVGYFQNYITMQIKLPPDAALPTSRGSLNYIGREFNLLIGDYNSIFLFQIF